MKKERPTGPIYEVNAGGVSRYYLRFGRVAAGSLDTRSRYEITKEFVGERITDPSDFRMRMVRPEDEGEVLSKTIHNMGAEDGR